MTFRVRLLSALFNFYNDGIVSSNDGLLPVIVVEN